MIADFGSSGLRIVGGWRCWCWSRRSLAAARPRPAPSSGHRRRGQVPVRSRHRVRQGAQVAGRARVFPQSRRQLSAERLSPRREAGARRHLYQRRHHRIAAARRQRVPRVPDVLPDAPARGLRAVAAGARRLPSRCSAPSATRSATKDAIKEIEIFLQRFPNSPLMPEARTMERTGPRSAERVELPRRVLLLPQPLLPRRDRSLQGRAEDRPGLHGPRRRLLPPRGVALSPGQEAGGTARTTSACSRNSKSRNTSKQRKNV